MPTEAKTGGGAGRIRRTRKESREETRAALIRAAAEAFSARGFDASSVDEITERAGFSRGAFYSNFETKEELLLEAFHEAATRFIGRFRKAVETNKTDTGHTALRGAYAKAIEDKEYLQLRSEFYRQTSRNAELMKKRRSFEEEELAAISALVDRYISDLDAPARYPTRMIALTYISLFHGISARLSNMPSRTERREAASILDLLYDLFEASGRVHK